MTKPSMAPPQWPWIPFDYLLHGAGDGPVTDQITLVEPNAKFSNGYGAMAKVRVTCLYDLKNKTVVQIDIDEDAN